MNKMEMNKILETLKYELKHLPYLYQMNIHFYDKHITIPRIIVCWRQWIEFEKKKTDEFTTITLESKRQCVECEYDATGIQLNYPIGILKLAIELKSNKYPEPCKGVSVEWGYINKRHTSMVSFPTATV